MDTATMDSVSAVKDVGDISVNSEPVEDMLVTSAPASKIPGTSHLDEDISPISELVKDISITREPVEDTSDISEPHVATTAQPFRIGEDFELANKLQDEEYKEHFEHNRQLHADSSLAISIQNRDHAKLQKERKKAKHTEKADARLAAFYQERAEREREEQLKEQEQQARIEQAKILHAEYKKRQVNPSEHCHSDEAAARELQDEEIARMLQRREVRKYRQQKRLEIQMPSPTSSSQLTEDSGYLQPIDLPSDLRAPQTHHRSDRQRSGDDRPNWRDRHQRRAHPSGLDRAPQEPAPPLPPRPINANRK